MLVSSLPLFWSCAVVWSLLGAMWFYSVAFEVNSFSRAFVPFQLCKVYMVYPSKARDLTLCLNLITIDSMFSQ